MKQALLNSGAAAMTVAPRRMLTGANGEMVKADFSFLTRSSVLFDAVYVPGGEARISALQQEAEAVNFLNEAFKHCQAIVASGAGAELLEAAGVARQTSESDDGRSQSQPGAIIRGGKRSSQRRFHQGHRTTSSLEP